MIAELKVMIFAFPVKWGVMFCKFNIMFLLCRIMLPRLGFIRLRCHICFEKAYYKNGTARGATSQSYRPDRPTQLDSLRYHFHCVGYSKKVAYPNFTIEMLHFHYSTNILLSGKISIIKDHLSVAFYVFRSWITSFPNLLPLGFWNLAFQNLPKVLHRYLLESSYR